MTILELSQDCIQSTQGKLLHLHDLPDSPVALPLAVHQHCIA